MLCDSAKPEVRSSGIVGALYPALSKICRSASRIKDRIESTHGADEIVSVTAA
jgi:hypothetical protein